MKEFLSMVLNIGNTYMMVSMGKKEKPKEIVYDGDIDLGDGLIFDSEEKLGVKDLFGPVIYIN